MGRGGGSHRSGGGGGHRSHSHSSHRSRSHYHSRNGSGGGNANTLSSLAILSCFFFFFFICLVLGFVMFLVTGAWVDDVCDGITSINKNEQRTCKPLKKEDVKIPSMKAQVTAYRYDNNNMPPTERHTTTYTEDETVYRQNWKYFDFALMKGGTVELTYRVLGSGTADVFFMNLKQYNALEESKKRPKQYIWADKSTSYATFKTTVEESGIYFIVVDNPYSYSVSLNEKVTISTDAYVISQKKPKESCEDSYSCKFKKVQPTETIIVSYSGSSPYVNVEVYHGRGSFDKNAIGPLVFLILFLVLFGVLWIVCFVKALKKCGKKAKKAAEKAAENAMDGTAKVTQSTATPCPVPMTPVGPTPGTAAAPPYPGYDPAMSTTAPAPYPYPGMDNPYPDGMPPPDPMNPYSVPAPAYGADPSAAPYPGQPGYGVPSTTV